VDTIARRVALNEALYRDVNENIRKATRSGGHDDAHFVCECGASDCEERIALPMGTYQSIRRDALHFFVKPGHEIPKVESVVERHANYFVVRKPEETRPLLEGTDGS
jgi:hypothetical protein